MPKKTQRKPPRSNFNRTPKKGSAGEQPTPITPTEYTGLQAAFDHFNAALFDGKLKNVMIVYQRRAHSFGHYAPD